ncbi:MAG TPA: hypothetical protein G4O15_06040 [Dehalococcoidia bacterium]|nr:hypothetical protein [Dehalococcoidia bacterium]
MADVDDPIEADELSFDPRTDIKEPLERTVSRIIHVSGSDNYAWDTILVLLFNHIDLLGTLHSGDSSRANRAKRAVGFIRSYLGRIDEKYAMAGGFLYYMLANGHVHDSFPGSFITGDGRTLRFEFTDTLEKQKHLSIVKSDNELRFIFSVDTFYKNLLDAIDLYCLDMSSDRSLREKYRLAWDQLTEPGDRFHINNHAYILASDLGFISDQIL